MTPLRNITLEQAKDTGMAMVLICLLLVFFGKYYNLVPLAIVLLLVSMAAPVLFKPVAVVWFGLSNLLGAVVSRIILTVIFFIIVTPIGLLRRAAGADPLKLKQWKKDRSSVLKVREHEYSAEDIEKPF